MADYAISGARLQPIYERLNSAPRYHPIEAETFADWSMEAGDIVTITRDGQSYESPVQTSVVKWRKGQQVSVSSGGNQQRDAVSKVSQNKYSRASGGAGLRNSRHLGGSIEASYNELAAGLVVTASGIYTYAINQYTGLSSGLTQTASALTAFVNSRYDEMTAGLEITSSSISQYVEDRYGDMRAGLDITSSSLHAYVRSRYEDMQAGLALTSSSAALYVQNRTTRAQIIARINGEGHSEALIEAENVAITGNTTLSGTMEITDGALYVKKNMTIGTGGAGHMVTINNGWINAPNIQVNSGGSLTLVGTGTGEYYTLSASSIQNYIKKAAVENNTLKLWKVTDAEDSPSISFSKATSMTGAWSGGYIGKFTMTAGDLSKSVGFTSDADYKVSLNTNGAATAVENLRKSIVVPMRLIETVGTSQADVYHTTVTVNAEPAWNNGWDDAKTGLPGTGTEETFVVSVAKADRSGKTDRTFEMRKGATPGKNGYASVVLLNEGSTTQGNIVARISIGDWYQEGWTDARDSAGWPVQDTSTSGVTNKFIVYRPSGTVGGTTPSTRNFFIGSEPNLVTIDDKKYVRCYVYYGSNTSNRVATLDRLVTAADLGITPESHTKNVRMRCAAVEYGSTGTKTVRFTVGYSATQSPPFSAGNDYTFYYS